MQEGSSKEEMERLLYLQGLYSKEYEAVMNEIASLSMAQAALARNTELLKQKDRLDNSKILISGGGGTYIDASIKGIDRVLAYVGAGYLVEKDVEGAKELLRKSSDAGNEALKKLNDDRRKLEKEITSIQFAMDSMQQGQ
jgi:prefoldin alpha subunit